MGQSTNPRRVADNEARAKQRMIRISPQKLNLVASMIRGKPVERADGGLELIDGIVDPADYDQVCADIIAALKAWENPNPDAKPRKVVLEAYKTREIYSGDFRDAKIEADGRVSHAGCCDIVLGFNDGYRIAWKSGTGGMDAHAISDNDLNWSGDHASNAPELVTGLFLSNRSLKDTGEVHLFDIAPTTLSLLGVDPPDAIDGKVLPLE